MIRQQLVRTLLPLAHSPAHADLKAHKADYAGDRAREEMENIESALRAMQVRLPAIVVERLSMQFSMALKP